MTDDVREILIRKLHYLEIERATLCDPAQKFQVDEQIRETKQKLTELQENCLPDGPDRRPGGQNDDLGPRNTSITPTWQLITGLIIGVIFLFLSGIAAIFIPSPTEWQLFVFRGVFAISLSAIITIIHGFIEIESRSKSVTIFAGGAVAIFVLIWLVNPPGLIPPPPPPPPPPPDDFGVRFRAPSEDLVFLPNPSVIVVKPILVSLSMDARVKASIFPYYKGNDGKVHVFPALDSDNNYTYSYRFGDWQNVGKQIIDVKFVAATTEEERLYFDKRIKEPSGRDVEMGRKLQNLNLRVTIEDGKRNKG